MTGKNCLQSFFNQLYVRLQRCDARLGLLLKRMQHVYCITYPHRVDGSKGVAPIVLYQFIDPGTLSPPRLNVEDNASRARRRLT